MEVRNSLGELRSKRHLSAAQLASSVGVSRQTIYAMEAGSYVPNTVVALKLARALTVNVEDIFGLEEKATQPIQTAEVELLSPSSQDWSAQPGQPLHLCRVGNRLIGVPAESSTWGLPAADALIVDTVQGRAVKVKVQILEDHYKTEKRLLLAGCDPSAPVLACHLQRQGISLVISYQNSSRSLTLLKQGVVHVAGMHLAEGEADVSDLAIIRKLFGKQSPEIVRYALWEEGMVVAPGNPKRIHGIRDLTRTEVSITNREPGAGCRLLLEALLERAGIGSKAVKGYERIALGHLPAARQVREGESDCCISTRATARALGLHFIPLVRKRYDLVFRKSYAKLPQVEGLIETLGHAAFRRELETLWGYDAKTAGDRQR
jgi:molybdate-binding protein/DNA-binding XRE family transcriptional regulator